MRAGQGAGAGSGRHRPERTRGRGGDEVSQHTKTTILHICYTVFFRFHSIIPSKDEMQKELELIVERFKNIDIPCCLSHNDFHVKNIVHNPETGKHNYSLLFSITRSRTLATEVYKAVNGMTPNYTQELFEVKEIPYNLSDPTRTIIPNSDSTSYGLKSLKHEGNKIWNRLSVDIKTSESRAIFKI